MDNTKTIRETVKRTAWSAKRVAACLIIALAGVTCEVHTPALGVSAAVSAEATTGVLEIKVASMNVRSGAGTAYRILGTVKKGAVYAYTKATMVEATMWYYIEVNENLSGWVCGAYVNIDDSLTTTTANKITTTTAKTTATTTKATTTAKTATAATTTVAAASATVTVKATTTIAATATTQNESGTLTVTGSSVNVRSGAGTAYRILTTVKKGKAYTYSKYTTVNGIKWYCIKVSSSVSGWICGTYISIGGVTTTAATTATTAATATAATTTTTTKATTTTTTAAATTAESGTITVTGSSVNVRSGAGMAYRILATVKKNGVYSYSKYITVNGTKWYYIEVSSSASGWICGTYVSMGGVTTTTAATTTTTTKATTTTTKATTATAATQSESGTITVTGSSVNVRSGAGTSYGILTAVKKSSVYTYSKYTTVNGVKWYYIKLSSTTSGWICGTYVSMGGSTASTTGTIVASLTATTTDAAGTTTSTTTTSASSNTLLTSTTTSISYATSYNYLNIGCTLNLGLSATGVTYSSSDSTNCPISSSGVVTGRAAGLYTITAKCGSSTATTYVVVMRSAYTGISSMTISSAGTAFIAAWEGGGTVVNGETRFYPYQDVSGYWTIGYGHCKSSSESKTWDEEKAISELNADIKKLIGEEYCLTDEKLYLTAEGAKKLLNADLNQGSYVSAINNWMIRNGVKLTQNQFDALVSFVYNMGPAYFTSDSNKFYLKSAILAYRSGSDADPDQIIEGFCRYIKSGGKNYTGLWYRRRNEAEMFISGDYAIDRSNKFTLPSGISWAS